MKRHKKLPRSIYIKLQNGNYTFLRKPSGYGKIDKVCFVMYYGFSYENK